MKRTLAVLFLALIIALPFILTNVDAIPSGDQCAFCHNFNPALTVTATFVNCTGNDAYYYVTVSDFYNATEGWAVFIGNTNTGQNAVGNAGLFSVPEGQPYEVWGASYDDIIGTSDSNVITITPSCFDPCTDDDSDTYAIDGGSCGAIDCNDNDPAINPGAEEDCTDGIDNDCDDLVDAADPDAVNCPPTCTDADGDMYNVEGGDCGAVDCNDLDWYINPGAIENCIGGIDDDCDDKIDCDDSDCVADPACPTCVLEVCNDGIDNDCDNKVDCADKADCKNDPVCGGSPEVCNDGIDNDLDGKVDCADKADCRNDPAC